MLRFRHGRDHRGDHVLRSGPGDHIVCVDQAYGPTKEFLSRIPAAASASKRRSSTAGFVENISRGRVPKTKLIYLESPTSMLFELQDMRALRRLARSSGHRHRSIDNTWATPIFQQPLALGIDLVVHSITKYIAGHSDSVGGRRARLRASSSAGSRTTNTCCSAAIMTPHTAALVSRRPAHAAAADAAARASGLTVAEHVPHAAVRAPGESSRPAESIRSTSWPPAR